MNAQHKPHRSIGVMVLAAFVTAGCGVVLTFCVPRLLSVDDFGIWRAFLLYAGYAGLLHLGLIDGALLLWSKRAGSNTTDLTRSALTKTIRFVLVEHLLLIFAALAFRLLTHAYAVPLLALAFYAVLFNLVALVQVYLQARLRFTEVAIGASLQTVLFVIAVGLMALSHISVQRLLEAYLIAWVLTLALHLVAAYRKTSESGAVLLPQLSVSAWRSGLKYTAAGWPIMLANTGFGLMQSADRVTVNLTRPLHDFALYSLSQSTIYVPIAILAAVSRVAFSSFARSADEDQAVLYRTSTRLVTMLWMLLLPYFFLVEAVVRRWLPRYAPGLPAGCILLVSVLFLSLIQIVQLNTFSIQGRQRQFFVGSIIAVVLAFATAWVGSVWLSSLSAVAGSQVVTALLWWFGNEWLLRDRKLLSASDRLRVVSVLAFGSAGLFLASVRAHSMGGKIALYYLVVVIPLLLFNRPELRSGWLITGARLRTSGGFR